MRDQNFEGYIKDQIAALEIERKRTCDKLCSIDWLIAKLKKGLSYYLVEQDEEQEE